MKFEREDISYDSTILNMKVDNGHDYENIENILYHSIWYNNIIYYIILCYII